MGSTSSSPRPTLAITMGDPGGIGPEVIVKALAEPSLRRAARYCVYGPASALHRAAAAARIDPFWWQVDHASLLIDTTTAHDVVVLDYARDLAGPRGHAAEANTAPAPARSATAGPDLFPPTANKLAGELSFRFVDDAIAAAKRPPGDPLRVDAIVTGPINKHAWSLAGHGKFPGHTELLASRFHARRHAMFFHAPRGDNAPHGLNVVLATVHIPLMDIRNALTIGKVFEAIDLGHDACSRLGYPRPRIAVCGLNPHAGEAGILGDEESRLVEPAIRLAQEAGIDARGPFPGDTIFNAAVRGQYDLVVAMYHDQGLIPVKLLARDRAVNITLGLPTVRTSPDHGTAFDIAGKNKADEGSMKSAIEVAIRMAGADGPQA